MKTSGRLARSRTSELWDLAEAVVDGVKGAIEPLQIARSSGITTSFGDYANAFDGLLEAKAGSFHIFYNSRRVERPDSPRARFTLAHELGHFFIDEHRHALLAGRAPAHPSFCEYQSTRLVEVEADCFASRLLMPETRFRLAARRAPPALDGILELAATFKTSVTATAIRYVQMDLLPCVLIKWKPAGFGWKHLSESAYAARLRKTVESIAELPRDCPTVRVLSKASTGVERAGTTKAAWFPFVDAASGGNDIFHEQAMSLGRYGALTLLYPA